MSNLKLVTITGLFIGAYMCTANWSSPYISLPTVAKANDVQELTGNTTGCTMECNNCQNGCKTNDLSCKRSCVANMNGCCIAEGAKPNIGGSICMCN